MRFFWLLGMLIMGSATREPSSLREQRVPRLAFMTAQVRPLNRSQQSVLRDGGASPRAAFSWPSFWNSPRDVCRARRLRPAGGIISASVTRDATVAKTDALVTNRSESPVGDGSRDRSRFRIRRVDPGEVGDLSWLVAEAFTPRGDGVVVQCLLWITWLQVYLGMSDRIFTASFFQGLSTTQVNAPGEQDISVVRKSGQGLGLHSIFLAEGEASEQLGAVELCMRACAVPKGRVATSIPRIVNLAVRQEDRGLGVGKALLRECESEAIRWGFDEIVLETRCDNTPALWYVFPLWTN